MKIGMFLHTDFPPDPRVENQARSLIQEGHEVFIFCLAYPNGQDAQFDHHGISVYRYNINKLTYKSSAVAFSFPFYRWALTKRIKGFVEKNKIEALHVHNIYLMPTLLQINKNKQLPLLLDIHENIPEILKLYSHTHSTIGKLFIHPKKWKSHEEKMAQSADHIVTVTEEAAQELANRTKIPLNKLTVVPNTSTQEFIDSTQSEVLPLPHLEGKKVILYVGDTALRRGLITAIEGLHIIQNTYPNLVLCIVGKNKTDNILKEKVSELGLENKVYFEGWQSFEKFPSYLAKSTVGICPIHRNLHHDTTFANKLFQYAAYGLPLLLSDCPVQERLVKDYKCGEIHTAKDPQDFAEKLELILQPNTYKKYSQNAKKMATKDMVWEKTIVDLLNYYSTL